MKSILKFKYILYCFCNSIDKLFNLTFSLQHCCTQYLFSSLDCNTVKCALSIALGVILDLLDFREFILFIRLAACRFRSRRFISSSYAFRTSNERQAPINVHLIFHNAEQFIFYQGNLNSR